MRHPETPIETSRSMFMQRARLVPLRWLPPLLMLAWLIFSADIRAQVMEDATHRLVVPSEARSRQILAFEIQPRDSGRVLQVSALDPIDIFIGEQLLWPETRSVRISVDSLLTRRASPVSLTIVRPAGVRVMAYWSLESNSPLDPGLRIRSRTQEFVILMALPLIFLGLWLAVTNRRVISGFFQFGHLFTWTHREDPMSTIGITSTVNLIFYLLIVGVISIIGTVMLDASHDGLSMRDYLGQFTELAGWLMLFVLLRILTMIALPRVYGFRNMSGQFYGLIRLFVLLILVSAAVYVVGFSISMSWAAAHRIVRYIWLIGVLLYEAVALYRLLTVSPAQALHLFSYLCLTEIIPLFLFSGLLQSQANFDLR